MRPLIVTRLVDAGFGWLGPLVPTDGAVYAILFVALIILFLRRAAMLRLPAEDALATALAGGIGAAIGTRLFYLLSTGAILHTTPLQWLDASRGTASWGAYLGAVLGVAIATVRSGRMWTWLDLGASCAALGEVIGRWGCWLAGDDFGRVTGVAWGIRFPAGSPAYQVHAARGLLAADASTSLPVHPLQFYLMFNALVVLIVTTLIWRRWRIRPGLTFGAFLILHGATRFWWEFLRDPAAGGAHGLLSTSQWTCAALVAGGAVLLRRRTDAQVPEVDCVG